MDQVKAQWSDIPADEEEETQPQEQAQQQQKPHYQKQQQKPQMQSRSEIEKLIDKCSDEEILLNIVKCHFEATVDDIIKTFVQFNFVKVENYNPGSFSLVFKSKEAAKDFLYKTKDQKIKDRGFWIKFPLHHQKSSKPLDNPNRENPIKHPQNKKFYDAPPKHQDNYNRKQGGDEETGEQPKVTFFRSDNKQIPQPERKPYIPPKKKEEDDDGWITVEPQFITKARREQQQQFQQQQNYKQRKNYQNNNNQKRQQ
ncbi:hypothetical protein pb186bvf_010077 [Paramecium bursaria]